MTTHFGTPPALLSGSGSRSSCGPPTLYANSALLHLIAPVIALAYGSMSSLAGLKRLPVARIVRTVDAVAVELAGPHVGQVAVPDLIGALAQLDLRATRPRRPCVVEEAQLDAGRVLGEDREVDALPSHVAPSG